MNNHDSCSRKKINKVLITKAQLEIKNEKDSLISQSNIFSLLGNEVRYKIVFLILKYEKLCVCDLADILEMSQSPISQHLKKLKDAKILENDRQGVTIFYFITKNMKIKLINLLKIDT